MKINPKYLSFQLNKRAELMADLQVSVAGVGQVLRQIQALDKALMADLGKARPDVVQVLRDESLREQVNAELEHQITTGDPGQFASIMQKSPRPNLETKAAELHTRMIGIFNTRKDDDR